MANGTGRQKRFERRETPETRFDEANPYVWQVVSWLIRLRFMTTEQISRILDPPRKRSAVFDLLRRAYDAGFITRFDVPVRRKWGASQVHGAVQAIHCLDHRGAEFLAARSGLERGEVDWKMRDNQKRGFLDHTLATNDALVSFHLGAKQAGWNLDIVQTERDVHRRGGHDWIQDPGSNERKPVKPDTVCCLTLAPENTRVWLSLELDMGTEAEKKVKQKFRLHRAYYAGGGYQARFGTKSNRVVFVVADVRDPWLAQPPDQADWKRRVHERVQTLRHWAAEEGMTSQFWFAPAFELTPETVWREPVWLDCKTETPIAFV